MAADRVTPRRALVTGGGGGLGLGIARRLAAEGLEVATSSLRSPAPGVGERWHVNSDLAEPAGADRLVEEVRRRWGGLEILVNNAGVAPGSITPTAQETDEGMRRVVATNVLGPLYLLRGLLPLLRRAPGGGAVVNIASRAGLAPIPGLAAYSASKSALVSLTLAIAKEESDGKVFLVALCPGGIANELRASLFGAADAAKQLSVDRVAGLAAELAVRRSAEGRPVRSGAAVLLTQAGGTQALEWRTDDRGVETLSWR